MCTKKGKLWEIDADSDDTDADIDEELMSKWADEQMFRWADEQMSNFFKDIAKFSEPNSIPFRIFSPLEYCLFSEPNWIQFRIFSGLRYSFFPNQI